jgi:hypothetical protein
MRNPIWNRRPAEGHHKHFPSNEPLVATSYNSWHAGGAVDSDWKQRPPSRFHRNARQETSDPRCDSPTDRRASEANSYKRALTTLNHATRSHSASFHFVRRLKTHQQGVAFQVTTRLSLPSYPVFFSVPPLVSSSILLFWSSFYTFFHFLHLLRVALLFLHLTFSFSGVLLERGTPYCRPVEFYATTHKRPKI